MKIRKRTAVEEEPVTRGRGRAKSADKGKVKKSGGSGTGRYVGRTSGLGVIDFQNKTLEDNRKKRMTDAQLAKVWRDEFPNARAEYTEDTVRGVRNLYNLGKHWSAKDADRGRPAQPVPEFDEQGKPLAFWGEKAAAKRAEREEQESPRGRATRKAVAKKNTVVKKVARR